MIKLYGVRGEGAAEATPGRRSRAVMLDSSFSQLCAEVLALSLSVFSFLADFVTPATMPRAMPSFSVAVAKMGFSAATMVVLPPDPGWFCSGCGGHNAGNSSSCRQRSCRLPRFVWDR